MGTALYFLLPNASPSIEAPSNGRAILEATANTAAEQPSRSGVGQIRYSKRKTFTTQLIAGEPLYRVHIWRIQERWVAPDGSGRTHSEFDKVTFPTSKDEQAWQAAGRPSLQPPDSIVDEQHAPAELSYEEFSQLPTETDELFAVIEERASTAGPSKEAEMFIVIGDLLRFTGLSPDVRAGLFRVASRIPGIEAVENAEDPDGRIGIGLALTYDDNNGSLVRVERIFDQQTTQLLAEKETVVGKTELASPVPPPDAPNSEFPPIMPPTEGSAEGTVLTSTVYLGSGNVNSIEERP